MLWLVCVGIIYKQISYLLLESENHSGGQDNGKQMEGEVEKVEMCSRSVLRLSFAQ